MKGDINMEDRNTYTPQIWENLPSNQTPVSAERLTHMEDGIKEASNNRSLKEIYDDNGTNMGQSNTTESVNQYVVIGNANKLKNGAQLIVVGNSNNVGGGFNSVFGSGNTMNGTGNITSGTENTVEQSNAAAFGTGLIAVMNQTVVGRHNEKDAEQIYAFIVGGGNNYTKENIHTVDWNGNAYFKGDVTAKDDGGNIISLREIKNSIMTYDETITALNSKDKNTENKIPNAYAIRDWCKQLLNPESEV